MVATVGCQKICVNLCNLWFSPPTAELPPQNHERPACKQTDLSVVVGMTGFEPAAPRPPGVCATGLRHIPLLSSVVDTGFEPVTSAMSMQRSKPTELIDRLADVSGCKYTTLGQSAKVPSHYFTATLGLGRGGEGRRWEVRTVVTAAVLGNSAELPLVLLYVVGKGGQQPLGVLGSKNDAALHLCLRGIGHDTYEVYHELGAGVGDDR